MKMSKEKLLKYVLPIVVCVLIVIFTIVFLLIKNNNKQYVEKEVEGYAKLIEHDGDVYTFVSSDYNTYSYKGYADMNDFYYNVTCVSKKNEKNEYFLDDALINIKEEIIVDYGEYDDITQVFNGKYYKVEKDNKYGIIDYNGNSIVPVSYEYITISNILDDKECIFICELNNKYDYINESGKVMLSSENNLYSSDISCYNKFNDEYDTVVVIGKNENRRYFNLSTGEELFKGEKNLNFKYNMQIKDKNIIIFNKDMSIKEEIDSTSSYSILSEVYYKKYIVLSEKKLLDGKRSEKHTVFDENYNNIFTSDSEVFLIQDKDENIYFLTQNHGNISLYNKKGIIKKIDNHSYDIKYNENCKFFVFKRLNENVYDIYDFKGNIIIEDVSDYKYYNNSLVIAKKDENTTTDFVVFDKDNLKQIVSGDNIVSDKYVIIENIENKTIQIYNLDGKVLIDQINGVKEQYSENFIIVKDDTNYSIYDINKGKKVFEYAKDDFVSKIKNFELIKLKDGYYNYLGKKILDLNNN